MQKTETRFKLLLVEDDTNLGYLLKENLRASGYTVQLATTGPESIRAINASTFDLCLFDIMLPQDDGFSLAAHLRKTQPKVPFLFITARAQEADRLHGFELGADDYILKPFCFRELEYRLRVILRRHRQSNEMPQPQQISLGNISFNYTDRMLTIQGKERRLSQREAGLLQLLLLHHGTYVSRTEILTQLWGTDDYFTARSMDVYLTRIRKLVREEPDIEIENLYGSGYRIRLKTSIPASE